MYKIKNKLSEKRGTALMLALLILSLLTIISTCFALAIPSSYQIDYNTMKLEQATIYAKAGLNLTITEIMDRASNAEGGQVKFLKALGDTSGFTGKLNAPDYNEYEADGTTIKNTKSAEDVYCPDEFPDFKISFERLNKNSNNEILKVISEVEYQGAEAQVFRYIYYSADDTNPFPPDAISCTDKVDIASSVFGRIRAREVILTGEAKYHSMYSIESMNTNDAITFLRNSTSTVEGMEGNVYSKGNLKFRSFKVCDENDDSKMGGTVAAVGYIAVVPGVNEWGAMMYPYGGGQPEALIAYGNPEKYNKDGKNYAIRFENTNFGFIGNPDTIISGVCKSNAEVPVAIYSNGDCYLNLNADLVIYGNVYVNGDFHISNFKKCTIYGNIYATGEIKSLNGPDAIEAKKWKSVDSEGNEIWLGGKRLENLAESAFALAIQDSTWVSQADIEKEVGERNLRVATLPTLAHKDIQNFLGNDVGGFGFTEGENVYRDGSDYYCVLRVTQNCEIKGTPTDFIDSLQIWNDDETVTTRTSELKDSAGNPIRCNGGGFVSLFLDASNLAAGKTLDVVISGEWFMQHPHSKPVRIYVNDNDGQNTVRLFLRKGTDLRLYHTQAYVPNSAVSNITGQNLAMETVAGAIPGVQYDKETITVPRLFIFSEGELLYGSSYVPNPKINDDESVMPYIYVDQGSSFQGYILTPLAKFEAKPNSNYLLKGKVCCGYFKSKGNQDKVFVYVPVDENVEKNAIKGVFSDDSGSSSGGGFSLTPKS